MFALVPLASALERVHEACEPGNAHCEQFSRCEATLQRTGINFVRVVLNVPCLHAGNEGQGKCGDYQFERGGSRCCDSCTFNTFAESVCCEAGEYELCSPDGFGCCPPGALDV